MAWIELHQSLPQHRKLLALRDALGLRTPAALGHMCLLWLWALDNAPDGDLSALPARQLAEICQFSERRAGDLAVALRTSGFVDADALVPVGPAAALIRRQDVYPRVHPIQVPRLAGTDIIVELQRLILR